MKSEKLIAARHHLDEAIKALDLAHGTWSEAVTTLHMAEINLRLAQRQLRQSYNVVAEVLNGDG